MVHQGLRELCPHCPRTFTSKQSLTTHMNVQHLGIKYPCDRCDFSAGTITYMNMHIKVKHEGFTFNCEEEGCNSQSKDKSNLRDHVRVKHRLLPKKFKCKIQEFDKETKMSRPCSFETGSRPHLLKHKTEVHKMSAQDMHSCDKCGYTTNQAGHLKAHYSAIHEGTKFACPHCGLTLSFKNDLKRHMRTRHMQSIPSNQGNYSGEAKESRPSP